MSSTETIVCKPTPWFLLRAVAMLLMFGVFAVLFYVDGSTGYRDKNEQFYLNQAFRRAMDDFKSQNQDGQLTPEAWKAYAAQQSVPLPEDASIFPADFPIPHPWPDILQDYDQMKSLQWNQLWIDYAKERRFDADPPEEPYPAQKIREQWIVFFICSGLFLVTAFFLIRTLRRSITADDEGILTQEGKRVPYGDLKKLDLRKWETKGIAFADYEGASGKGRVRLDGLTYGGFKKDKGEPAEQLMNRIRSRFSGELIEYASVDSEKAAPAAGTGE